MFNSQPHQENMTPNLNSQPLIKVRHLKKDYRLGESVTSVLRQIDLDIFEGEALCLLGSSGAGKSTLLQILGTLDRPTEGEFLFQGQPIFEKSEDELAKFRNQTMGFVFQFHHLIQELTALENIMMPALIAGKSTHEVRDQAVYWLQYLGLELRENHYPNQLSGGELQRVSIARALMNQPRLLFADEPTGNLDSENSLKIQNLFFELQKKLGLTLVVVTHDLNFAQQFSKIVRIKDGCLTSN